MCGSLLLHVGPRDQSGVARLGSKHLYPLRHLAGYDTFFFQDSRSPRSHEQGVSGVWHSNELLAGS